MRREPKRLAAVLRFRYKITLENIRLVFLVDRFSELLWVFSGCHFPPDVVWET